LPAYFRKSGRGLFHRDAFDKVARLIDVTSALHRDLVRQYRKPISINRPPFNQAFGWKKGISANLQVSSINLPLR